MLNPDAAADGDHPLSFALGQNYPNPFNPATHIVYTVPAQVHVTLRVYDLLGVQVATLFDGVRPAGSYTATFDASGLADGVYFYRLEAAGFSDTRKLVVLK